MRCPKLQYGPDTVIGKALEAHGCKACGYYGIHCLFEEHMGKEWEQPSEEIDDQGEGSD